ncbi:hypothetical protein OEZ85_011019 [Tetradesmus obliquus]|uniref:Uncharacterized protein n=1 Tax=Tetradesmus obliquus TaxID=3088 RepID=A0ABY8TR37_TETOB|nr:hypothetical protein OEZ85_011019 [Tetradesmus obliquus]
MEQFRQSVLDYVQLTDDVAEASKALNTSRKRLKDLRTVIIQHMTDNKIDQCNLKDGTLTLKSSKAPPPLNKELMVEALQQDLGSEKAEALADKPLLAGQLQHQQSYAVPSLLSQCFEWLFSEFCPRLPGDMFELVHCLATCNAHVQNITVGFFQRCQPFAGATRAVVLTNMYCQKLMLGCSYADDIEQVLRAYEPQLNTQE